MTGETQIEAVLLTGGASRRMAVDKASIPVGGVPLGQRVAAALAQRAAFVTVLGRTEIPGYRFLEDPEEFAGPLAALARFEPSLPLVFVASCDLPAFEPSVIDELADRIQDRQAAIPELDGRLQPLCALYRAEAFLVLREMAARGEQRMMRWISELDADIVPAANLTNPVAITNVNTPQELGDVIRREPKF